MVKVNTAIRDLRRKEGIFVENISQGLMPFFCVCALACVITGVKQRPC